MSTRHVTFAPFDGRRLVGEVIESSLEMAGDCRAELIHTVVVDDCTTPFRVADRDVEHHE